MPEPMATAMYGGTKPRPKRGKSLHPSQICATGNQKRVLRSVVHAAAWQCNNLDRSCSISGDREHLRNARGRKASKPAHIMPGGK